MEKFFAFLPLIVFLAFFGFIILIFSFIMLKVVVRVRKDEWKGEVVDKIYNEKIERDPEFSKIEKRMPLYTLVIKTNEGIERKVAVTKDMFESCKIGDKFIKEKGSLNPRKLND